LWKKTHLNIRFCYLLAVSIDLDISVAILQNDKGSFRTEAHSTHAINYDGASDDYGDVQVYCAYRHTLVTLPNNDTQSVMIECGIIIIIVTHMTIARQRVDKHLPAETDSW
jgi:hypothetical protein